jgi:hypothetical protein
MITKIRGLASRFASLFFSSLVFLCRDAGRDGPGRKAFVLSKLHKTA